IQFLSKLRARTNCLVRGSSVVRPGWRLSQATEYLYSLPVDSIKAQAVRVPTGSNYALSDSEISVYLDDLESIGRRVINDLEEDRVPIDDRFSNRVLQLLKGEQRESFCGAGQTVFGITPNGFVLPCILLEEDEFMLGHINDRPSKWIQTGYRWKKAQALRSECKTCNAFILCGGGCPAIIPICSASECQIIRKNCEVATHIYEYFQSTPTTLLTLAGIT
ncbi:MAG: SPASM domain-containing protein, partial [Anaerolineales bacterium]